MKELEATIDFQTDQMMKATEAIVLLIRKARVFRADPRLRGAAPVEDAIMRLKILQEMLPQHAMFLEVYRTLVATEDQSK